MHPKTLSISDFTYDLPTERIANFPLEQRDDSKLLVFQQGSITTSFYKNIDQFLPTNSLLVFNNTKVVEARLLFQKATGAVIEIFCLEPDDRYADITSAMMQKGRVWWKCMIGGASKWKHGMVLEKAIKQDEREIVLRASISERLAGSFVVELWWEPADLSFAEMLHYAGYIPLPPYMHREAQDEDKDRYQTIYAKHDGSVAAPTAGLHFTERIFEKLDAKHIKREFVTLHVGAGTFKPVKAETLSEHEMHAEFIDVSAVTIQNLIANLDNTIVSVGTTSLRTLESLYWIGVKIGDKPDAKIEDTVVQQWDPYETVATLSAKKALGILLQWLNEHSLDRLITKTQILIAPGYKLRIAKGIITNFHQPQSTLLLLIAAIVGDQWKSIYQYALENEFRFLSYGDGCLLWESSET